MDRASPKQLLSRGLSLAEIGRRAGLHEATVGYWVKRHGLEAANHKKHAARGALAHEELTALADAGMSIAQIASTTDRSKGAVRHWLGKYDLRTRGGVGRRSPGCIPRGARGWPD